MRDAHAIAVNIHRAIQAGNMDLPLYLGERSPGNPVRDVTAGQKDANCREQHGKDDQHTQHPEQRAEYLFTHFSSFEIF
jgi:hypothetical protein